MQRGQLEFENKKTTLGRGGFFYSKINIMHVKNKNQQP